MGLHAFLIGLARAVHIHRLRRFGAHDRGNAERASRTARDRMVHRNLPCGVAAADPVTSIQNYGTDSLPSCRPAQIFTDAAGSGATFLVHRGRRLPHCGMSSVTANSRMIYASRDGAAPGSGSGTKSIPAPALRPTPSGLPRSALSSWGCRTSGTPSPTLR